MSKKITPSLKKKSRQISFELLPKVSRSFALAIKALPEPVQSYICTAYLLCRIVDTIEDHPTLDNKPKYFDQFENNLLKIEDFENLDFDLLKKMNPPEAWDQELMQEVESVFYLFSTYPKPIRDILKKWVLEMSIGMRKYTERGGQSSIEIIDTADLDQYCYYVAGTVGNLLTEIFAHHCGIKDKNWLKLQKERGYHFAQGLQKVNIIKDVAADFKRGSVFMPKKWLDKFGLTREDLIQGNAKEETNELLRFFITHTAIHLEKARDYILNIPSNQKGLRLFCIWPYTMALDTLNLALKKDGLFSADHSIKVPRAQMFRMMAVTRVISPWTFPLKLYFNSKLKELH